MMVWFWLVLCPDPPTKKIEKGSGQKGLVKRVALPCPTRQKSCRANQIAESLSYDVNGMLITSSRVQYSRVALSGATFPSPAGAYSVMEKTKPRSVLDHLSMALLPLSKGDRPAKVCARVCVCGYPQVENYFRLHSAGTRKCDPFDQTLSRLFFVGGSGTRLTGHV